MSTHHPACDIAECGDRRCDVDQGGCGERMTCMGPEPRACGEVCVDCECRCETCRHVREDMRADLLTRIEREAS